MTPYQRPSPDPRPQIPESRRSIDTHDRGTYILKQGRDSSQVGWSPTEPTLLRTATREFAGRYVEKIKEFRQWLLQRIAA